MLVEKKNTLFSFCEINATKFGTKNEISHKIIYNYMTSYGYVIMIIADSCIIWFHLDYIMQMKKSYYIATNVSSRKSAAPFGDLPDCFRQTKLILSVCHSAMNIANAFV